ncbi:MAG: c-type cytochrome [Betaproteobacteria bacterium]
MTNKHSVGHLAVRKSTLSLGASILPRSIAGYAATFMIALSYGAQVHAQQAAGGDAKAGADKRSQCIGCHGIPGYKASFPRVYNVPMIAGQNAKYIEAALTAYRKGDRPHPTMRGIAGSLSDADIADLAAYYASR